MRDPKQNTLIVTFSIHEDEEEDDDDSLSRASRARLGLQVMMKIHEAEELSTGRYLVKTTMTPEDLFNSLRPLVDMEQDRLDVAWAN